MNIEEDIKNLKTYIELVIEKNYCDCNELNTICYGKYGDGSKNVAKSIENVLTAYEKEKEKNKNAYRKANNYLYFNDSADYEVALWEVIRTLRPDLAEKWDNGEDAVLEYIEEE